MKMAIFTTFSSIEMPRTKMKSMIYARLKCNFSQMTVITEKLQFRLNLTMTGYFCLPKSSLSRLTLGMIKLMGLRRGRCNNRWSADDADER